MEIHSQKAAEPVGPYPHARRVGEFLFLSGIGPRVPGQKQIPGVTLGPNGELVAEDFDQQFHSMMRNVKAVLQESGAELTDVVDVTMYLTQMSRDFQKMNRIYAEYFRAPAPTRTTVEIKSLPTPICVEIKCVAYLGSQNSPSPNVGKQRS